MHGNKQEPTGILIEPSLRFEETNGDTRTIRTSQSVESSNWISFKKHIERFGLEQGKNIIFDLSETTMVDHSVLNNLQEMKSEFARKGLSLKITVKKENRNQYKRSFVENEKVLQTTKRITIFTDPSLKALIEEELKKLGTIDFTSTDCVDLGTAAKKRLRLEVLTQPEISNRIIKYLQEKLLLEYAVSAYIEDI